MNRQEAKDYIKKCEPTFLDKAPKRINGEVSYICPSCGNGSGSDGTGLAFIPGTERARRYKCFKCGLEGDIIELFIASLGGCTPSSSEEWSMLFDGLYTNYGIMVDENTDISPRATEKPAKADKEAEGNNIPKIDLWGQIKAYKANVKHSSYFHDRGLSDAVIEKYWLGYDMKRGFAIIPTSQYSYVARNTKPGCEPKDRYRKQGPASIFNAKAIGRKGRTLPLYITEGEIDALSIIEAGADAIGLGSTSNIGKLLKELEKGRPDKGFVIALDNDKPGKEAAANLEKELEALDIPFYRFNPYGDKKDANEALLADRGKFTQKVQQGLGEALGAIERELNRLRNEYEQKNSAASHLQAFVNGIAESVNTAYIPTGFPRLDKVLDGGLYEGLYLIGAISSLGKTTMALQIADQVAKDGNDVVIFSLEMARSELMAKSISRLTAQIVEAERLGIENAKTTRGITVGKWYTQYTDTEKTVIEKAVTQYGEFAGRVYIHEGMGDIDPQKIRREVARHIDLTGNNPVVIVDYVQIIAPSDVRASDKQNTDKAVLELKRISRDFKIPVIGISSFNRASYKDTVSMEAFKESGGLEYGSDVLIGLQLQGVGNDSFDVNAAKQKNPRDIELVILKNRNGKTGAKLEYFYNAMYNYFEEKPESKQQATAIRSRRK